MEQSEQDDAARWASAFPSVSYVSDIHEHLEDTRLHLYGQDDSDPLDPSDFGLSFWTSEEKDLFFHGLSIYSRLRPDLIAADIGTKSTVEVTAFIDMLEEAAAEETSPPYYQISRLVQDLSWDEIPRLARSSFPIAMEMSSDWCRMESKQADLMAVCEPVATARATQRSHEEAIEEQRLSLRAGKGKGKLENNERDRKGERVRRRELKAWVATQKEDRKVNEFKNQLDGGRLAALDVVLREAEEKRSHGRASGVPSELGSGDFHVADAVVGLDEQMSVDNSVFANPSTPGCSFGVSASNSPMSSTVIGSGMAEFDLEMIDPALRSTAPPSQADSSHTPVAPSSLTSPSTVGCVSSLFSDRQLIGQSFPHELDVTALQKPGLLLNDTPNPPSQVVASDLSPASRRRLYKRMYMRRKRAEKSGTDVDQSMVRLKPGRKAKSASSAPSGDIGVISEPRGHPSKSGVTLPYRMRSTLNDLGFDAERIQAEGFDLLRLSNFHKLMR